jgi:dienelactone hydrolase
MIAAFSEVELDSRNPVVLKDILRPDLPRIATTALLCLPPPALGPGPFPGLVVCHGLGGVIKNRELRYASWLAGQGVAVLVVDCYAARGMSNRRDNLRALTVTESMYLADAFAGLAFLARHERVIADRIGVMGFSYGGMVSVLTAYRQIQEAFARDGDRFAGHISFYGPTAPRFERTETTGAPVMIVNGVLDRNLSLKRTEEIAADLRAGGSEVDVHSLEGAYHQWDGEDKVRQFKSPALKHLKVKVTPDYRTRCERWGLEMKGYFSRAAVIAMSSDVLGYNTIRNDETRRFTDTLIGDFIETHLKSKTQQLSSAAG